MSYGFGDFARDWYAEKKKQLNCNHHFHKIKRDPKNIWDRLPSNPTHVCEFCGHMTTYD